MAYLLLALAIVAEVVGTASLKAAEGFTRLGPSLLVVFGYGAAFFLLSLTLKALPLGFTYAVWSGLGIVLAALIGWAVYGETPTALGVLGMALIVAGVVMLNLFSRPHGG